jgi:hypothetical protein
MRPLLPEVPEAMAGESIRTYPLSPRMMTFGRVALVRNKGVTHRS